MQRSCHKSSVQRRTSLSSLEVDCVSSSELSLSTQVIVVNAPVVSVSD